jgi:glycosyltransferase involved in cell wall biosynthesis
VAEITSRLAAPASRQRAMALHPLPALCRGATPGASEGVALAAEGAASVHALRLYLAPFLDALLDRGERPRLTLDVDDVESVTHRRLGNLDEAGRYERLEAHYLSLLDQVITSSRADADLLAARYGLPAPAAVPNATWPPAAAHPPAARHDLIFVGNLSYAPNIDAAVWLCEEIMPMLEGVTLALVGSRPAASVRALAGDRVTVAADVPEVGSWYAGAAVAVAPLRAGGGTRTKVIEALAHGRAVVATSAAVEGLELAEDKRAVLVADTPAAFADACWRLLDDRDLAARMASRGEELVRAAASVDRVAGEIDELFRNILGR